MLIIKDIWKVQESIKRQNKIVQRIPLFFLLVFLLFHDFRKC